MGLTRFYKTGLFKLISR